MTEDMEKELNGLLDENGRIKVWPKRQARKAAILAYLATKFEDNRIYTEKEVNAILDDWHLFNDYFILRRGLIEARLLTHDSYGKAYQKAPPLCKDRAPKGSPTCGGAVSRQG